MPDIHRTQYVGPCCQRAYEAEMAGISLAVCCDDDVQGSDGYSFRFRDGVPEWKQGDGPWVLCDAAVDVLAPRDILALAVAVVKALGIETEGR